MAFLPFSFDASTVEPASASFPAAPAGDYLMQIIASEMKATTNGNGQFLAVTNEIIEGDYKGTRVFENINLVNDSQMAVDIAMKTLSAICHATGKMDVTDSEALHFIPFIGSVKFIPEGHVTKGKNGRADYVQPKDKNEMGGYKVASGSAIIGKPPAPPAPPAPRTPPAAPAAARPATTGNTSPWGARARVTA